MGRADSLFRTLLTASLLSIAACGDDVTDPGDLDPPELSPATQWAGGTVRLTWEGIDGMTGAPALTLNGNELDVVATDIGWAEYRVPATARGQIRLVLDDAVSDTFDVNVLGFRSATDLDVALVGNLIAWPRGAVASVVGAPGDFSGVVQVRPGAATALYLLEDSIAITNTGVRSVGLTYDPDLLLLPRGSTPELWRLVPTPQVVDTLAGMQILRHAMLLSDSIYIRSTHHTIFRHNLRSGSMEWGQYEETRGVAASPDGRYGAFRVNGSAAGPPVIDGRSGTVAFHVDTLFRSYGVDFAPTGDTLYIAGIARDAPNPELLLAVDASTGATLATIDLGAREPINIVRDRNSPMLFVMAAVLTQPNNGTVTEQYSGDAPVMIVIDSRTMEIVGEMATTSFDQCNGWCEGTVTVGTDGVFFVMTGDPARVLAFDGPVSQP